MLRTDLGVEGYARYRRPQECRTGKGALGGIRTWQVSCALCAESLFAPHEKGHEEDEALRACRVYHEVSGTSS